jgi:hypothetical protein
MEIADIINNLDIILLAKILIIVIILKNIKI